MIEVVVIACGMIWSISFSKSSIDLRWARATKQSSPVTRSHSTISGSDRHTQSPGIDHQSIALDHAGFLEPPDPFSRARRGEADDPREFGDAGPRVCRQSRENAGVEGVEILVLISKATHGERLWSIA
jgi:hypothetical protein